MTELDPQVPYTLEQLEQLGSATDVWAVKKALLAAERNGFLKAAIDEKGRPDHWIPHLYAKPDELGRAYQGTSQRIFRAQLPLSREGDEKNPSTNLLDWYEVVCEELAIDISGGGKTSKPAPETKEKKAETKEKKAETKEKKAEPKPEPKAGKAEEPGVVVSPLDDLRSYLDTKFADLHTHTSTVVETSTGRIVRRIDEAEEALRLEHKRSHAALVHIAGLVGGPDEERAVGGILKSARKVLDKRLDEFDVKDSPLK